MRTSRTSLALQAAFLAAALLPAAPGNAAATCEGLARLPLPNAAVTLAQHYPAGKGKSEALPAFCRVAATLRPSADSEIKIELWLPEPAVWNGKYLATGNGGWGGSFNTGDMTAVLARNYATSSTDTGHTGDSARFALGHPEKLLDFGFRAVHEMTSASKTLLEAYYGKPQSLAYFSGCSSGGRQALMEAQRYPADFDGIVAGAPTNNWTRMMVGRIWVAQATLSDPESYIPPAQYPLIHHAALEACDALDGVKDGVLEDPTRCHFDPAVLLCKGPAGPSCLTAKQVQAAQRIYTPANDPVTHTEIFPAMERGSELSWARLAGGPQPISLADEFFKFVVFDDPQWDFRTLNFSSDVARAEARDHGTLTANDPDLRPFFAHGGKLIEYQGWTDQQVMPRNSILYHDSVAAIAGPQTDDAYRLFMAPGMNHCGGGDGPNTFDTLTALEQWRETGKAPDAILASHSTDGKVDRTRPLCPWPKVARYKGKGSTDDAANFACLKP